MHRSVRDLLHEGVVRRIERLPEVTRATIRERFGIPAAAFAAKLEWLVVLLDADLRVDRRSSIVQG
jgi:hypothetical protein